MVGDFSKYSDSAWRIIFLVGLSYLLIKPAGASQFLIGKWIARLFSGIMKNEKIGVLRYVFSGMANGLLPCGMVYVALAGTTLTYSATSGAQYMMFFGLGTMPALLLVGAVSNWIKQKLAFFKSKYVISGFLIITGALMLFRGLSLDINYLSPQIKESQTKTDCYVKQ